MKKRIDGAHGGTMHFEHLEDDAIIKIEDKDGSIAGIRINYFQALQISIELDEFIEMSRSKWPNKGDTK